MSGSKKVVAVIAASGLQGSGVIDAILADGSSSWGVRALTRNPQADKGAALSARGVEVVAANLDDVESLKKAFEGCYGLFAVTNWLEHGDTEKEIQQCRNIAEAAKATNIQHVVWSTLEDTRKWCPLDDNRIPTYKDKYKAPMFDGKGEADGVFLSSGVPTTCMRTSMFFENLINYGMGPQVLPDGIPLGNAEMPFIYSKDVGACAFGVLKAGDKYKNQTIGIMGDNLTCAELAKKFASLWGKDVGYTPMTPEAYASLGFPYADALANMMSFMTIFEHEYVSNRSLEISKELHPKIMSVDQWLAANHEKVPNAK